MKTKILLIAVLIITLSMKSDKPAYQLYDSKGKATKYDKMIKVAAEADIVFFGELHNNPICHWMQLQITKKLHKKSARSEIKEKKRHMSYL